MSTIDEREQMWENLRDPEFRKQFIDEHVNVGIAFQIQSLRNRQNLTQKGLAGKLKVKQPLVSSWENPNHGKYNLATLNELAKAFDVGLLVRFVPFSTLVDWTVNLSTDVIAPPSFAEEEQYHVTSLVTAIECAKHIDANNIFDDFIKTIPASSFLSTNENTKEPVHA